MSEPDEPETVRIDGNDRTTNRRRVLQGMGALGLTSSVAGLAQAKPGRANAGKGKPGNSNAGNPGRGAREVPIGSQLFTYGFSTDLSVAELVAEHANAGYDVFEPFFIDDADAIAEAMEATGVEMSTAHVGIGELEDDFEGTVETYAEFGADALVAPSGGDWSSEASIIEWAETINYWADRVVEATDGEMTVGYHNHDHEFETVDGTVGYEIFAEHVNDNVHLQVDVAWAWAGGANPVELVNRYSDNVESLHMKDAVETDDGVELVEIGEGDVPLKALANVARTAADVDYLIYEYDGAPDPIDSLYTGAEYLERWNGPEHRSGVPSEDWPPRVVPGDDGLGGDPPSDATVLWDGDTATLEGWEHTDGRDAEWIERGDPEDGYDYFEIDLGTGDLRPEEAMGDCQLHLEWRIPEGYADVEGYAGNSGLFMMESYEFQILQSYDRSTYPSGYAGSFYLATPADEDGDGGSTPLALPIRPPGEWNEFDVVWRGPRSADGELVREPQVTLFFNGVAILVHDDVPGPNWWMDIRDFFADDGHPQDEDGELVEEVPFSLQDHGGEHEKVHYRNVWYRDLPEYDGPNDPPEYDTANGGWEDPDAADDPDHPAHPEQIEPGGTGTTGEPPADADVLIDDPFTLEPGDGDWVSDDAYGDAQVHVEYRVPEDADGDGPDRGASGVLLMGEYELNIVDTFANDVDAEEWAGAYTHQNAPHHDVAREPGEWQQLDIVWQGPRFEDGDVRPAQVTAFLNGVAVQTRLLVDGPNADGGLADYEEHPSELPLRLTEEGSEVQFRNTWARSLD